MLSTERILALFSLFSDLTGEELEPWRILCEAAGQRIADKLRPGANVDGNRESLCAAAAAWAYCDYLMMEPREEGVDSVKVGDITLSASSGAVRQDAVEIRDYFMDQVTHLLLPDFMPALVFTGGEK